ncbi:MAG: hypothetical protein HQK51_03960 [Oligoflexia bacterium]|nr:hypothetical protein [Oligoflexia bacterium]
MSLSSSLSLLLSSSIPSSIFGTIGSLFIHTAGVQSGWFDLFVFLKLKQSPNWSAVGNIYRELIATHPELRKCFHVPNHWENSCWHDIEDSVLKNEINRVCNSLINGETLANLKQNKILVNSPLPLRITRIGQDELVIIVDHRLTNGLGALAWGELLLSKICKIYEELPSTLAIRKKTIDYDEKVTVSKLHLSRLLLYLAYFSIINLFSRSKTIDLSSEKKVTYPTNKTSLECYNFIHTFTENETFYIINKVKNENKTLTVYFTDLLLSCIFELFPLSGDRISVCIPSDSHKTNNVHILEPGNFTTSIILQSFRKKQLFPSIKRQLSYWLKFNLPQTLISVLYKTIKSPKKFFTSMLKTAKLPISQRGVFSNYTVSVSNMGVIHHPSLVANVSEIQFYSIVPNLILISYTFNSRLYVNFSFDRRSYEIAEIELLFNTFRKRVHLF